MFALICSGRTIARSRNRNELVASARLMSRYDPRHKYLVVSVIDGIKRIVWKGER